MINRDVLELYSPILIYSQFLLRHSIFVFPRPLDWFWGTKRDCSHSNFVRMWDNLQTATDQQRVCSRLMYKGRFPLRRIRPRDQAMGYQGMRSSKPKLKASVYSRTRGQFWKLNQVQLFREQNERKPVTLLPRACNRTGSRDKFAEVETGLKDSRLR